MKERIDKLVDIYLNYSCSGATDAGWHGPGKLDHLEMCSNKIMRAPSTRSGKDENGDVLGGPAITVRFKAGTEGGGADRADDKMINEIRFLRGTHHDFKLAVMLLNRLQGKGEKYVSALLAKPYLKQIYKKPHSDKQAAEYLAISFDQYRNNLRQAYTLLSRELELIDQYEDMKKAS